MAGSGVAELGVDSGVAASLQSSPFFNTPPAAEAEGLAILHLKRDSLLPVTLKSTADDGYAEGAVTNTRFGSFPHSTLIGLEWGSQVRASKVDTGTRGRKGKKGKAQDAAAGADNGAGWNKTAEKEQNAHDKKLDGSTGTTERAEPDNVQAVEPVRKKRKSDESESAEAQKAAKKHKQQPDQVLNGEDGTPPATAKAPVEAGSGFVHLLPPTPESWTSSLDHRTQDVYTPDYSYILQRLRAKPGSTIIEAGAGSGSFTHAAARAVFSGYPSNPDAPRPSKKRKLGKVYSYEFHEPRVQTLRQELSEHGLDGVVQLTHRDACNEGFLLPSDDPDDPSTSSATSASSSPDAEAIFLDLPAPWQALRHLTRESRSKSAAPVSPLNPDSPIHLCTFSPCIEQVIATVSHLRKNEWTEIEMVEVANRRIDVRREQVGLKNEGLRGVNASAATVDEAIGRLREVEQKLGDFHAAKSELAGANGVDGKNGGKKGPWRKVQSKAERLEKIKREAEERKIYKEGNLVHRTEPEVKTHTSYLVFAVLPRDWSEEDEGACAEQWAVEEIMKGLENGMDKAGTIREKDAGDI